jgi:hypothetical protein
MMQFAALLALGLCAEPQDKPVGGTDAVKPVADVAKMEADVKKALDRLECIERGLGAIEARSLSNLGKQGEELQAQLNEIKKLFREMRAEMDEMKRSRVSTSEKRTEPTKPMAVVMLVNARPDMPMEALVNGTPYLVEPNQSRNVSVPAGALQVRVVNTDAAARERMVEAGATHVVTLR